MEKELAKTVIKRIQDSTQELDQEVEEVIRLGRYSEEGRKPMKGSGCETKEVVPKEEREVMEEARN
ncbi:hypothetical protein E2C01_019852 [Portunus trituberculatus]|uniref:Uncharacterized protein n=1 Tax=Portunus trituberculatus TaxID=210409 RepID=A0A5B7E0J2_PORTR|nr:hypothetical protein [Portunus trituberculatus]